MSRFFIAFFFFYTTLVAGPLHPRFQIQENPPEWMEKQIHADLEDRTTQLISRGNLNSFFATHGQDLLLARVTIKNNLVFFHPGYKNSKGSDDRSRVFQEALNKLARIVRLPDTVFLLSLHDGLGASVGAPIFVMAKDKNIADLILVPDFDALKGRYQVLAASDVTKYEVPWEKKIPQLIWRGGTAQRAIQGNSESIIWKMQVDNLHLFSRVKLCQLSLLHPDLIDAKFTSFSQGGEKLPYLQQLRGPLVSFERQFDYKYHILIDGNTCAYSASGWKYFTNSLVLKPNSRLIQWYYNALKPGEHYLAIEENLDDLVEKLAWAQENDEKMAAVAKNARLFAIENLTVPQCLHYLYYVILRYSQLQFVD